MKSSVMLLGVTLLLVSCKSKPAPDSPSTVALPPKLDSYFEDYCDYTGSLGLWFDPSHSYDFRFRQELKKTRDPELKRLFVLQHLHEDVEFALNDFEKGIIATGKSSSRPLTPAEWQSSLRSIQAQIDDLTTFAAFTNFASDTRMRPGLADPGLDTRWIGELRERIRNASNARTTTAGSEP